jgi:RNA polymerase sigma-70 factor (ECF subfamily)
LRLSRVDFPVRIRPARPSVGETKSEMSELDVEETYRRYFPVIREKCSRMLHDPAEAQDVAQETFTRLWSDRARLRNADGVASWIYRTSTRLAVDRHRQSRREDGALAAEELVGEASPERRVASRQLLARVAARIPADELEVAVLSRVDGLGHEEIALVVGTSDRTVRRLLQKFEARIARLREAE